MNKTVIGIGLLVLSGLTQSASAAGNYTCRIETSINTSSSVPVNYWLTDGDVRRFKEVRTLTLFGRDISGNETQLGEVRLKSVHVKGQDLGSGIVNKSKGVEDCKASGDKLERLVELNCKDYSYEYARPFSSFCR